MAPSNHRHDGRSTGILETPSAFVESPEDPAEDSRTHRSVPVARRLAHPVRRPIAPESSAFLGRFPDPACPLGDAMDFAPFVSPLRLPFEDRRPGRSPGLSHYGVECPRHLCCTACPRPSNPHPTRRPALIRCESCFSSFRCPILSWAKALLHLVTSSKPEAIIRSFPLP